MKSEFMNKTELEFKNDNYTCTLVIANTTTINLSGYDDLIAQNISFNQEFDNTNLLLDYLREIRFDKALNYHLSFFTEKIIQQLYKRRLLQ